MKKSIVKRALASVLCLLMLVALSACSGSDVSPLTEADVTVIPTEELLYHDGESGIVIDSYLGSDKNIGIPKTIDGVPVVEIAHNAFSNFSSNSTIEKLFIPDTVTAIGEFAMRDCPALTDVYISDSVETIGICAFDSCTSLVNVRLPENLTQIPFGMFYECESLRELTIPESVTYIDAQAFYGCKSLKKLSLPGSVEFIGDFAFAYCRSLKEIVIPESVTSVSIDTFTFYKGTVKAPHNYTYYGLIEKPSCKWVII